MTKWSTPATICTCVLTSVLIIMTAVSVPNAATEDAVTNQHELTVAKAITYLKTKGQASDGSYSSYAGIGPTALVTTALLRNGVSPYDPQVAKSLSYIEKFAQADGGIYQPGTFFRNYETCLAILCFTEANEDGRYDEVAASVESLSARYEPCNSGLSGSPRTEPTSSDTRQQPACSGKERRCRRLGRS